MATKAVPTVSKAELTLVDKLAVMPVIAPVASIVLALITNLEMVLPSVCPELFDVGTIAVVLILSPVVVCEAALTVPV